MNVSTKIFSAFAAAGIVVLGSIAVAPAHATTGCPSGAFEVIPDVCQIVVTESGDVEFPSGIGRVTAIIVGGGGGGAYDSVLGSFAGGASGVVRYVDDVDVSAGSVSVVIGTGGASALGVAAGSGTSTVLTAGSQTHTATPGSGGIPLDPAIGGSNADFDGATEDDIMVANAGGAGANGPGTDSWWDPNTAISGAGGPGFDSFSEVPGVDTALWPNSSASDGLIPRGFAQGGSGYEQTVIWASQYGSGGPGTDENAPAAGQNGVVVFRFAVPGSGGGASDSGAAGAGSGHSNLARTGVEPNLFGIIAGGIGGSGIVFAAAARRRTRSEA